MSYRLQRVHFDPCIQPWTADRPDDKTDGSLLRYALWPAAALPPLMRTCCHRQCVLHAGGDWLQGPYVYALYQHYGYTVKDIGRLFIAGFGSSMIFGTIVGSLADKQ